MHMTEFPNLIAARAGVIAAGYTIKEVLATVTTDADAWLLNEAIQRIQDALDES